MKWYLLLSVAVLWSAQGAKDAPPLSPAEVVAVALTDYRAGNYELALALLEKEWRQVADSNAAEKVVPQVRLNAALCALRLLRSRDAQEFVLPLAEDERWAPEVVFILGLASCQHAERAVVAAKLADAEPMAWLMATRAIKEAELQFRRACRMRPQWPEAIRNLERTILRRIGIEEERSTATKPDAKKEAAPNEKPPAPQENQDQAPEVVIPEIAMGQLTGEELAKLQQRVREQQEKKVRSRTQHTRGRAVAGERDW